MKLIISYIFVAFFIGQSLFLFREPTLTFFEYENRLISSFPAKPALTSRSIRRWFADIERYFVDRLFLRTEVTLMTVYLDAVLGHVADIDKSYMGKNGWLFLGNRYNQETDKLTGLFPASASSDYITWLSRSLQRFSGLPVAILLAPNKSTIYPEFLPDIIRPAKSRYSLEVTAPLKSRWAFFDAAELLRSSKGRGLLYFKTDSHWNMLGASIVAESFLAYLSKNLTPREKLALPNFDLAPSPNAYKGDLINIGQFYSLDVEPGDNYLMNWNPAKPKLRKIEIDGGDTLISAHQQISTPQSGNPITIINSAATTSLRAWIFRDSFSTALSPFFNAVFSETCYFYFNDIHKAELPIEKKPDLIIFESVERHF